MAPSVLSPRARCAARRERRRGAWPQVPMGHGLGSTAAFRASAPAETPAAAPALSLSPSSPRAAAALPLPVAGPGPTTALGGGSGASAPAVVAAAPAWRRVLASPYLHTAVLGVVAGLGVWGGSLWATAAVVHSVAAPLLSAAAGGGTGVLLCSLTKNPTKTSVALLTGAAAMAGLAAGLPAAGLPLLLMAGSGAAGLAWRGAEAVGQGAQRLYRWGGAPAVVAGGLVGLVGLVGLGATAGWLVLRWLPGLARP